jgi:hypothetical protein
MSTVTAGSPAWHLYVPKLYTVLRLGYGLDDFRHDLIAGLTVAVVALPLAMALAIASGTTPDKGLQTAIVITLKTTGMKAAVGPPICTRDPPRAEIRKPVAAARRR